MELRKQSDKNQMRDRLVFTISTKFVEEKKSWRKISPKQLLTLLKLMTKNIPVIFPDQSL